MFFSAKRKKGHFSVIPAGTRSVANVGHLFWWPRRSPQVSLTSFRVEKFFLVENFLGVASGVLVICPFNEKSQFKKLIFDILGQIFAFLVHFGALLDQKQWERGA